MKIRSPLSQISRIFQIKKGFGILLCPVSEKCVHLFFQYLDNALFPWFTTSVQCDMEVISLWHCGGVTEALVGLMVSFSSPVFLCWVFVIFLLTVCHWFSVGFRSGEKAGYSSTAITWWANHLVVLASWAGVKSCCKRKLASPWILPAVGSIKCSKMSYFRV